MLYFTVFYANSSLNKTVIKYKSWVSEVLDGEYINNVSVCAPQSWLFTEKDMRNYKKDLISCSTVNILLMTVKQAGHKYADNSSA